VLIKMSFLWLYCVLPCSPGTCTPLMSPFACIFPKPLRCVFAFDRTAREWSGRLVILCTDLSACVCVFRTDTQEVSYWIKESDFLKKMLLAQIAKLLSRKAIPMSIPRSSHVSARPIAPFASMVYNYCKVFFM